MTATDQIPSNAKVEALSSDIDRLSDITSGLEIAAKIDMEPKVERLQVMQAALLRDLAEADREEGASGEVARQLYTQLHEETHRLKFELGALAQGNPTTISAVGDAGINAIDAIASEVGEKAEQAVEALQAGVESIKEKLSGEQNK